MTRPLAKSLFVLLSLGLIFAYLASLAEDGDQNALNRQVTELIAQEKYREAIPIAERALAVAKRVPSSEQYETALNNLGFLFQKSGDYAKAEPLYQEVLRIRLKVLGKEHPDTAQSLNNLGALYLRMGEPAKAEPLLQEALRIRQKVNDKEHPNTATSLNNLAALYEDMGELTKAEPYYLEALQIRQKVLGAEHPDTATSLNNLAALYQAMGEFTKAEPLYRQPS